MKQLRLLALVLLLCLPGGCGGHWIFSDYREIDQLELVQALGLDHHNGMITATASGGGPEDPVVLRSSAGSMSRAMRQMQDYTSRKYIFFGHTSHLLLGEEAAKQGLEQYLEHMEHFVEMRLNTFLYIVREGTAEEAITATGREGEGIVSLLTSLEKDVQLMSESHVFTCGEVAEALAERGCALAAAVSLAEQEDILAGESPVTIRPRGYAILKAGKLAGYLDPDLARGANLLLDLGGEDILEVPDGAGGLAALRLTGSRVRYMPEFLDGTPVSLTVRVELDCSLEELRLPADTRREETMKLLERGAEELELERIRQVLVLSRAMEADFCGIGGLVRQVRPLAYDGMEKPWEEVFPTLPLEVEVRCRLLRTYDAGEPPLKKLGEAAA